MRSVYVLLRSLWHRADKPWAAGEARRKPLSRGPAPIQEAELIEGVEAGAEKETRQSTGAEAEVWWELKLSSGKAGKMHT